ncbi:electron transport complex subunit RsxC [Thalassotalea sp. Y01]|uniref:electron transport complex subunit RsxC n=1 Tax=Thalassotalea sp. Y01 TaxID=2729613 RepID=UPI00145E1F00|nr:electron transport complex subunit RsxC [Thalassotalea sp. Y01]
MESVLERIKEHKYFNFAGGIHPPEQKFLSNTKPIKSIALPKQIILPLKQHVGKAGEPIVKVGDKVLKGQQLSKNGNPMAVPVHAPTSGTIVAIKPATIAHPSAMKDLCIILEPDGEDKWRKREIVKDFKQLSKADLIDKIAEAGIAGMGGAGFPTNIKVNVKPGIKFLIINAAECEPYITADDLLMREQTATIASGIDILDHLLEPEHVLIGIEDNKPEAIGALKKATAHNAKVQVCVLPTKYPTGGEKQLIKALTNQEVPSGVLPVSMGIIMQNVATVFAISEAVLNDTPLIRRVVTLTGKAIDKPQNLWVPLGTPIEHLLQQVGFKPQPKQRVIMGGPLMGFALADLNVPAVKITNCILAPSEIEIAATEKEIECVRCGQCADVCPSNLLPQELQWYAKAKDFDKLQELNLFDCIDCGACAYVCPSHIPLVHYYRVAKATIRQNKLQEGKAERAKLRFEARKIRLEREKLEREEKHKKAMEARRANMTKDKSSASNSAVAAALARVKAKKAEQQSADGTGPAPMDAKARAAAAIERAKAKKKAQQQAKAAAVEGTFKPESADSKADDARAAAKARAIAKAKQRAADKKAAASESQSTSTSAEYKPAPAATKAPTAPAVKASATKTATATANNADKAKSARVASAVAKAKAKKAAKSAQQELDLADVDKSDSKTTTKPATKTAAKPATKTAAKPATKTAAKPATDASADTSASAIANTADKPAATSTKDSASKSLTLEEALAKSKQQAAANNKAKASVDNELTKEDGDQAELKKARIAAAIAKAKAKKQAETSVKDTDSDQAADANATENTAVDTATNNPEAESNSAEDDKKARISAAIAKAKAKKQNKEQQGE